MKRIPELFIYLLLLTPEYLFPQSYKTAAKRIDSLFASYNTQTPGAAVAVVKDGKVVFMKGYGMANLDHNIPITPQTVFNIASVSKQFTAFVIYLLESEGKLSFEDDIRKYIPSLPDYGTEIKIKYLLAHTSGLRDFGAIATLAGWRLSDIMTTENAMKLICNVKETNFTPGTQFNYNNTGYLLLGEIVKSITGKTLAEYTEEKIFKPLGMKNTHFCDNSETVVKNRAESYERSGNAYYHKPVNTSVAGPSNLLTTVEDLTKWLLNFDNPKVGSRTMIASFNQPSYLNDGKKVVLRIVDGDTIFHAKGQNLGQYNGVNMITHGGHTAAFRTFMGRFPAQRLGIIALSNDEHNENLRARWQISGFYISEHFLMKEQTAPSTARPAVSQPVTTYNISLKDFEGEYVNQELKASYIFKMQGDKLVMTHIRLSDLELNRTGENKFTGSGPHTYAFEMDFTRNDKGEVEAFSISNFGVKNLRFIKLKE